jgi:NAD-dependent dihydropyrimidine dehydrogenase PreA subunit
MSPGDRAALTRLLLERGLEVSCRHDEGVDSAVTPARTTAPVLVSDGSDTAGQHFRVVDTEGQDPAALAAAIERETVAPAGAASWKPWFPVIDYSRCTNCMQCLSFCLFDVYGVSSDQKIQVQNQSNCKTECPACSRVCPEVAIMFPKYRHGPINGEDVKTDDVRREAMKVDISALLGGDI